MLVHGRVALQLLLLIIVSACSQADVQKPLLKSGQTAWGFTPFPYDITPAAVNKVYEIIDQHATLFAIHRDNGIPWQEAYDDKPFPKKVRDEWQARVKHIKSHHKVYVGLAPLASDRQSLAEISEGSGTRNSFRNYALNSVQVKRAYLNYVRRAVDTFNPDYLNIGIEVGELAGRSKSRWRDFHELFSHVRTNIRKEHPNIMVGISFGLQSLMASEHAEASKKMIEMSDYVGISFYPYQSEFHEALGSRPLPPPPNQWLAPLAWVRAYTDKPIAITETGYTTRTVTLNEPRLNMPGSADLQNRFLADLAKIAGQHSYLFVTWFLPVDYQALAERAGFKHGEVNRLWEYIGFFDPDLKPKPAWDTWEAILRGEQAAAVAVEHKQQTSPKPEQEAKYQFNLGEPADTFQSSPHDHIAASNGRMQWTYDYGARFQYLTSSIPRGSLRGSRQVVLDIQVDQDAFILISFEEASGEAYWSVIPATSVGKTVVLEFTDFQVDKQKSRKNGNFDLEDVNRVTIADARGFEGARGRQMVSIGNWRVE